MGTIFGYLNQAVNKSFIYGIGSVPARQKVKTDQSGYTDNRPIRLQGLLTNEMTALSFAGRVQKSGDFSLNIIQNLKSHPKLSSDESTAHQWLVPSRPPANLLEARPQGSNWPPRPLARVHQPPEVSRSLTATSPVQWLSVKSGVTRSQPNCSSASCHSSVWFVKSPRTSRPT